MTESTMVLVPADLLTTIVRYLMQRPYAEVAQLVPALLACKPPEPKKRVAKEKK